MLMIKRINLNSDCASQLVELPYGSEILSVGYRDGSLCIWVKFDSNILNTGRIRKIWIVTTERYTLPEGNYQFLGTVVQNQFEFHLFLEVAE